MINGFLVQKSSMQGTYSADGVRRGVTNLLAKPMVVTQIKTKEKDGYESVQLAYGTSRNIDNSQNKKLSKLKLKLQPKGFVEFKNTEPVEIGTEISVDKIIKVGDSLKVTAISKGRGFQGVIKRHGFSRQGETGGASNKTRAPGAIGAQTPGKVLKGKRMPGHMGNKTATVLNLEVIAVNPETNTIQVKGSVPGHINSWVRLEK